jgi:hypothetical protein
LLQIYGVVDDEKSERKMCMSIIEEKVTSTQQHFYLICKTMFAEAKAASESK